MQRLSFMFAGFLVLALALSGCEPAEEGVAPANGDGRVRLSVRDSSAESGDYRVHVNAMSTSDLTPEVAQAYGIKRSNNQGLINVVVLHDKGDGMGHVAVKAKVDVSASNLTGQLKEFELREVEGDSSIYYIGEVGVDDREMINFDLDIQPADSPQVLLLRYSHQFYTK